jgi:glycosyltransferase involved in cell wall biosynthesis
MNNASLHVLHIASGDLWAGAEVQLYTLARELHTSGQARVSVVLMNPGRLAEQLRAAGIEVTLFDESRLGAASIFRQLYSHLRRTRPDVVHTHRIKENVLGGFAARLCGIPSLRTVHGAQEHPASWRQLAKQLMHFLDWFCGRFVQRRIIAVAEDLAAKLAQSWPANRIHVIENGIELTASPATTTRKPRAVVFNVGIAGRLVAVKRVDLFIHALHALKQSQPEAAVRGHIYGDGPLRAELQALCTELDADAYIQFDGHVDDMATRLCELDLLLMTSDHEGLPMILLEAMRAGTPVAAHAVGGMVRVLDDGRCGLLVKQHDAQAYADAIYRLYTQPALAQDYAARALARLHTHYSAAQNAHRYLEQYAALRQG